MARELEKLWYSYLIETTVERTDKDEDIIKNVSEKYNILQDMLNKEQLIALQEYDDALLKVSSLSEKNSFIIGFKFAAKILLETLYEK
ncbi:MAG: hypothetical protein IJZ16_06630 [Clostridia bacterium]|nr:hypothetical protein [Clostridia bacterium]